ncbi:hypothetical protein [Burkholderia ubonensis]|uniref:scabin-related ADP-ribosyltransferase n=1 Tax=Burkholderia ubonensis TaxID=101571 RepID=UPI000B049D8C|nr:hypothetical protein [Burkholderia ubonensis]
MPNIFESLSRKRRIAARILSLKELPIYVYRWDRRPPIVVRCQGFQPWNAEGDVTLIEHVRNSYGANREKAGLQVKEDSQWVSTGAYGMLKRLDPVFAQQVLNTNLYKIDTSIALKTGHFVDVNDYFDRVNLHRPYATQREWCKLGGINPDAVIEYMAGRDFYNQLNEHLIPPDEDRLSGWKEF